MEPRGVDLLATLIDLLADQEGVKIAYEVTDGKHTIKRTTDRKGNDRWKKAS